MAFLLEPPSLGAQCSDAKLMMPTDSPRGGRVGVVASVSGHNLKGQIGVPLHRRHQLRRLARSPVALGAGQKVNALFPSIPPGTLTANLVGGYLIGVAVAYFSSHPSLPPEWRLLVVTGFLGGLTTFSTFSAEVVAQLMSGRLAVALSAIAVHVLGSLAMTLLGIGTVSLVRVSQAAGG